MFTSRAEYRLSLREDNADARLTPAGRRLGCVGDERWSHFETKQTLVSRETSRLRAVWVSPSTLDTADAMAVIGQPIEREYRLSDLLRRPEVTYAHLMTLRRPDGSLVSESAAAPSIAAQVEIDLKYAGYVDRQRDDIVRVKGHEQWALPSSIDYEAIPGLSYEARQKLAAYRPETLGQAARLAGVTPATISLLLVHLKRGRGRHRQPDAEEHAA